MRKIPTLFERDPATNRRHVLNVVTPGCEWVLAGEGTPTRKYDGSCCLVRDGKLYKRQETRAVDTMPPGFVLVEIDAVTGKAFGWLPVVDGPENRWHRDAWQGGLDRGCLYPDGTYELIGPKVQGNPEGYEHHWLQRHDEAERLYLVPRDFDGLRSYLTNPGFTYEGIVWHHPDGRMAKLKKRDYPRP